MGAGDVPDDGWKVGVSNTSSQPQKVTAVSMCLPPVAIRPPTSR
jgi:hypothetical protein